MCQRSRNWCFTLNNPIEEPSIPDIARYLVFGREKGESGTPHLQGFICYHNPVYFSRVQKFIPQAHWEVAKGSFEQASAYCKKDGDFVEFGDPPITQKRKGEMNIERWDLARKACLEGRVDDIPSELYIKYYRTFQAIAKDHPVKVNGLDETTGEWFYGTTGTGKSRTARQLYPDAYLKGCNKWWDGYIGQDIVIIEDFDRVHACLGHHLKIWGDHYSFPAEVKGGQIVIRPKRIIITSNWRPEEIWQDSQTLDPILRRYSIRAF